MKTCYDIRNDVVIQISQKILCKRVNETAECQIRKPYLRGSASRKAVTAVSWWEESHVHTAFLLNMTATCRSCRYGLFCYFHRFRQQLSLSCFAHSYTMVYAIAWCHKLILCQICRYGLFAQHGSIVIWLLNNSHVVEPDLSIVKISPVVCFGSDWFCCISTDRNSVLIFFPQKLQKFPCSELVNSQLCYYFLLFNPAALRTSIIFDAQKLHVLSGVTKT